jgi:hypothetical protein
MQEDKIKKIAPSPPVQSEGGPAIGEGSHCASRPRLAARMLLRLLAIALPLLHAVPRPKVNLPIFFILSRMYVFAEAFFFIYTVSESKITNAGKFKGEPGENCYGKPFSYIS